MKRSWITGLIVAAGIGILIAWIARNTYWNEVRVPVPLKGEAATNPFYTQQRLAEELGATAERRHTLGTLPPKGVIVLSSWHWSVIDQRRRQLERWVLDGGRLVLDATLVGGEHELQRWAGIQLHRLSEDEFEDEGDPEPDTDDSGVPEERPESLAQLLGQDTGVCSVLHVQPATDERSEYSVCNLANDSWLSGDRRISWALQDKDGQTQAMRVDIGDGSVTMLNARPFGNRDLLELDHALLFVAVTQLERGDQIVFLSEEKRASLLALMWRYGAPVVILALVLLALTLWRGAVRLGPLTAIPDAARRSLAEQIRGTGQFALRFGGGRALHAACVRALHETAQRRIPGYSQMGIEQRVARLAQITDVDAQALSATINYAGARRGAELRNAVMVIEYTRRRLLNATGIKGAPHAS